MEDHKLEFRRELHLNWKCKIKGEKITVRSFLVVIISLQCSINAFKGSSICQSFGLMFLCVWPGLSLFSLSLSSFLVLQS